MELPVLLKRVDAKILMANKLEDYCLSLTRRDDFRRSKYTKLKIDRYNQFGVCIKCTLPNFMSIINIYGDGKVVLNIFGFSRELRDEVMLEAYKDNTYTEEDIKNHIKRIKATIKAYL